MRDRAGRALFLVLLLYVFLLSIAMMGAGFKVMGSGFAERLLTTTANPVAGLLVGMLATALIQSSSTTTSIVVGLVAAEVLSVRGAVPIIMGANMGTSVTNTLVAMTAFNRREEFRRSFAGATLHDFFNLLTVVILFPIEQATHILERSAGRLADFLVGTEAVEFHNPVKAVTKPVAKAVVHWFEELGWPPAGVGTAALLLALAGIFFALYWLPKLLRRLFLARAEGAFSRHLVKGGAIGILVGTFITVMVQSSSITTSLLVPLIGAGILGLEGALAITLGANIGTTVTALLASTAGTHDAVAIALVHLLFNLAGILLIYPFRPVRRIPIRLATRLADLSTKSRAVPILYLVFLFFLLPGVILLVTRALAGS